MTTSLPTHGLAPFHAPITLTDWEFFLAKLRDHLCHKIALAPHTLTTAELADLSRVMANANTLQNNLAKETRLHRALGEQLNNEAYAQALAAERKC